MLIRFCSDLHLEQYRYLSNSSHLISPLPQDHETILILAGDIVSFKAMHRAVEFFGDLSNRFKSVLYIPGNHEYYGGNLPSAVQYMNDDYLKHFPNIVFKETISYSVGDYNFIGATYWTSFKNADPIVMSDACQRYGGMNDYVLIRNNGKLLPRHILGVHKNHRKFIFDSIDPKKKNIVFTHHAPTELSISEKFRGDNLNYCYVNSDFDSVYDSNISLWIHGHVHDSFDYDVGGTRIMCNPSGYATLGEGTHYDPELLIEL